MAGRGGVGHGRLHGEEGEECDSEVSLTDLDAIASDTLRRCAENDKYLHALDISDMPFTKKFFTQLACAIGHNTTIQELYLDNCQVDDQALRVLTQGLTPHLSQSGGSTIKVLSLEDNRIRCIGASHLAKALVTASGPSRWKRTFGGYRAQTSGPGRGLQYLSLKGNVISSIGAKAIAEFLMRSDDSLERLSLEANLVNDWGAGWFAMALRNHDVIQCLDLHNNPIGSDGLEELRGACLTAKASLVLLPPGVEDAEEGLAPMVAGPRCATVYLTEVHEPSAASLNSSHETLAPRQPPGSYRCPKFASRRMLLAKERQPYALGVEESVIGDADPIVRKALASPGVAGATRSVAAGRRWQASPYKPRTAAPRPQTAPPRSAVVARAAVRRASCHLRPTASSTAVAMDLRTDERETATLLVPSSRWCWKPRDIPGSGDACSTSLGLRSSATSGQSSRPGSAGHSGRGANTRAHSGSRSAAVMGGCGVAAARGLQRTGSVPGTSQ